MDYTRSCRNLEELIEEESKNVPLRRIAVGGFSQGGSVALYVAVFYPDELGALITLSTYILSKENLVKVRVNFLHFFVIYSFENCKSYFTLSSIMTQYLLGDEQTFQKITVKTQTEYNISTGEFYSCL